ncbi:hypothetical protein MMC22_007397 [Lobaria immixta]|nr:hypothetical protein [Lobaria immixta]
MAAVTTDKWACILGDARFFTSADIDVVICGVFHRKYTQAQTTTGLSNYRASFKGMSSTELWSVVDHTTRNAELKKKFNYWMATSPYHKGVLDNIEKLKLEDRGQIVAGIANKIGDNVDTKLTELSVQKSDQAPLSTKIALSVFDKASMTQAQQDQHLNETNHDEKDFNSWPKGPC